MHAAWCALRVVTALCNYDSAPVGARIDKPAEHQCWRAGLPHTADCVAGLLAMPVLIATQARGE